MNRLLFVVAVMAGIGTGCAAGESRPADDDGGGGKPGFTEPDGLSPACQEAADLKTSVGCDYYAVNMDSMWAADNGCFVSFVANTSSENARIAVSFGEEDLDIEKFAKIPVGAGKSLTYGDYDRNIGLAPGEVAILFLAGNYNGEPVGGSNAKDPVRCPVPAALPVGAQIHGTGLGQAFHVTTSVPVVAYQMLPYGGGAAAVTGATLLIPTTAWDKSYVAVNAYSDTTAEFGVGPSMNIVAAEDDTTVTIVPKVLLGAGPGVSPAAAGTSAKYKLNAGQHLQITQGAELTGSPVQADKPIGLFAGHQCTNTPIGAPYCDHAETQIPAVRALGSEYAAVSHRQRNEVPENPPYRIIGAVDGTVLTYEPNVGGPTTINLGDVVEFATGQPFVVRSQDADHPFLLLGYMTSATTVSAGGATGNGWGDPDVVRVVPPAQYLNRYVFFTDPTYPETNLVVVRKKGENGFADVELDCAGNLSGWTKLGGGGLYEYTRTDLVRHNFEPQGSCDNGRREMKSDEPFGLWVWGWGTPETQPGLASEGGCNEWEPGFSCYVSYGYPAGEGLSIINEVVIPVPE